MSKIASPSTSLSRGDSIPLPNPATFPAAVPFLAQQAALQDALGQFFDEERHTVGAIDNLSDHLIGQCLAAGDLLDQDGPIAPVQPIERHYADLRLAGPGRLELGTEGYDQHHRQAADAFHGEVEQLARGRVAPMRVLE